MDRYSKRYLVEKLRLKIGSTIKAFVSQTLIENGFIGAQQAILDVSDAIQNKINEDVLASFGVHITNLNITIEEDTEHALQRGEIEWSTVKRTGEDE
jgi:hypothetical protein